MMLNLMALYFLFPYQKCETKVMNRICEESANKHEKERKEKRIFLYTFCDW